MPHSPPSLAFRISIHAPTRVRHNLPATNLTLQNFNPRTHKGCDRAGRICYRRCKRFQSTHPQGVRRGLGATSACSHHFNPRTHKGCDQIRFPHQTPWPAFQSTHPQGVRRLGSGLGLVLDYFNPRTHKGCDAWALGGETFRPSISIHAPTRGATVHHIQHVDEYPISIHAPTRGATSILYKIPLLFYSYFTNFSFLSTENPTISSAPFYTRALFMQFFWCESPRDFLCTCNSHQQNPLIKSMSDPPQFLYLPRYVLLWFYTYFPDNKTSGCLCFHQ